MTNRKSGSPQRPGAADPEYPGPWSDDEWSRGLSLSDWAEWRDPEAWAQRRANLETTFFAGPSWSSEEERSSRLFSEAARRLRELLKADMKGGLIVLGVPGEPPDGRTSPVSKDTVARVVEEITFGADRSLGKVSWQKPNHEYTCFEVRVYLPGRFDDKADDGSGRGENVVPLAKAEKDCCRWLQEERGKGAPKMLKEGYWQTARERFKRLSRRRFDQAWANAVGDDPRWIKPGRKPKAPKT